MSGDWYRLKWSCFPGLLPTGRVQKLALAPFCLKIQPRLKLIPSLLFLTHSGCSSVCMWFSRYSLCNSLFPENTVLLFPPSLHTLWHLPGRLFSSFLIFQSSDEMSLLESGKILSFTMSLLYVRYVLGISRWCARAQVHAESLESAREAP